MVRAAPPPHPPRRPRAHAPRPTRAAWKYEVVEPDPPNRAIVTPKSYSDNFTWKGPKGRDFPDLYVPPPPPPPSLSRALKLGSLGTAEPPIF